MGRVLIGAAIATVVVIIVAVVVFLPPFLIPPSGSTDTRTSSREVAGFYGIGSFTGELLESDLIETNVTDDQMSQSIVFQGKVCQRIPGLGRVFLDGAKATEPDAMYKVYVNGMLQFTATMEAGSSSVLSVCYEFPQKEYVMTGQTTGFARVELSVYVFDFTRGAGAYEALLWDQAVLR